MNGARGVRGSGLAVVMMVTGVAMILAFMLASNSVLVLHVAQSTAGRAQALELAESAIAVAVAQIQVDQNTQTAISPTLTVNQTIAGGGQAYLTFVTPSPNGSPWSVNNLTGTTPVPGSVGNSTVPPACVQLLGTGRYGGIQATVQVILHFPPYPYVVASSGTFKSPKGGVTVGTSSCPNVLCHGLMPCTVLQPGDVASNNGGQPAILLGPDSKVMGNAQAVGSINLASCAQVLGSVQPCAGPVPLPSVAIQDPTAGYVGVAVLASCGAPTCTSKFSKVTTCPQCLVCDPCNLPPCSTVLTGMARAPAGVSFPSDLQLNGAILFVNGNLVVGGQLKGIGAILGTGSMTFKGGASLSAQSMIALAAGGNVTLSSPAASCAVFNGLIYTQGNLTACNIKLFGNFVANAACSGCISLGQVKMCNVTMVGTSSLTCLTLVSPLLISGASSTGSSGCNGGHLCLVKVCNYGIGGGSAIVFPDDVVSSVPPCKVHTASVTKCTTTGGVTLCIADQSESFSSQCALIAYLRCHPSCVCPETLGCLCKELGLMCYSKCSTPPPAVAAGPFIRVVNAVSYQPGVVYKFNFNQFIQPSDTARVLLWKEM